jgi:hydroxylamine reductase
VRNRPGILIRGHDLRDLEQLLEQTKGTGIDIYTHGEMLPANAYPAFKKYDNFAGNYGDAWWKQNEEFEKFNGPILMTTNCIIPPRGSYKNRIYTTGAVGFEGLTHIYEKEDGTKDFTPLIEQAKTSKPPEPIESGTITAGLPEKDGKMHLMFLPSHLFITLTHHPSTLLSGQRTPHASPHA